LSIPNWLHDPLLKVKRSVIPPSPVAPVMKDIDGERYIEWSFLSTVMPDGPGAAVDFGCENGYMSLLAAEKGFRVLAVDLQEQNFRFRHPNIKFQLGDFLKLDLQQSHFDLIINCSSVEHVGLAGRYGIKANLNEGDLEAMRKFQAILKPEGLLIMTAPCGVDAVMAPWCRVYGPERLQRLLSPFSVEKERYWVKDDENRWNEVGRQTALAFNTRHDPANAHGCSYALGCFVLRKAR
jgi:SAM-dependent methyltransferase